MQAGSLNRHSFHFRQILDGGYRYLDKCGEFLDLAENELDLIPDEPTPQGGVMSHPELGIKVQINTSEIQVTQAFPPNDGKEFLNICLNVLRFYFDLFKPRSIGRNGFDTQLYYSHKSAKDTYKKSLSYGGEFEKEFAKIFDMVPNYKNLEYSFTSGSKELSFKINNVSFGQISSTLLSEPPRASKKQRQVISRRKEEIVKYAKIDKPFMLIFVLDLMEVDPPLENQAEYLNEHFTELMGIEKIFKKEILKK